MGLRGKSHFSIFPFNSTGHLTEQQYLSRDEDNEIPTHLFSLLPFSWLVWKDHGRRSQSEELPSVHPTRPLGHHLSINHTAAS